MRPRNPLRRETVEFFFSFRSPYSYLAAPRVFRLDEYFDIRLEFRPVLPMVQRGVAVSRAKALFLLRDARREARRLGMRFGPIWDPVGDGALRCAVVAEAARRRGDYRELVLRVSRAIWAEAADVSRDEVLSQLVADAGLVWSDLRSALGDPDLEAAIDHNRADLEAAGHWGVPTLVWRGEPFWGQDRIEDLELALASAGLSTPRGHLRATS